MFLVPGAGGAFQSRSSFPETPLPRRSGDRSGSSELREAGWRSRFLWAGGQNHRGGETVHTQSRDVDLVTAVSWKLKEDRDT